MHKKMHNINVEAARYFYDNLRKYESTQNPLDRLFSVLQIIKVDERVKMFIEYFVCAPSNNNS